LLLNSKKTEVSMELKLFRFKQHIEEEMSQILSRLEKLETELAALDKQNQTSGISNSDRMDIIVS